MRIAIVSAQSLQELDPFDYAFVEAVLRLQGIDVVPSQKQLHVAIQVLNDYFAALMRAPESRDPIDAEWLDGHTLDSAAAEFAFLFMHYNVLYVSQASGEQLAAFSHWWSTGEQPTQPSLHVHRTAAAGH
jgi:hypothetical protein